MPRKKRVLEVGATGAENAVIQIPRDPLSPRDRLVIDMLLELVSVRGAIRPDVVDNVVDTVDRVSERLGWNV